MSSPINDFMYINIPKNASTWTRSCLASSNWEIYNYHTDRLLHKHSLVVLRDPIDRWVSGIAEYMYLYHRETDTAHLSKSFFDLILDRVAFDDHTEKQVLFIEQLNINNTTFFWCDSTYRNKFSSFLNSTGLSNNYNAIDYQHVTDHDPVRKRFKEIFKKTLNENSKYQMQLKNYFSDDYEFIKSVKFYQ